MVGNALWYLDEKINISALQFRKAQRISPPAAWAEGPKVPNTYPQVPTRQGCLRQAGEIGCYVENHQ